MFEQIPKVQGLLSGWLGGVREKIEAAQSSGESSQALMTTWASDIDIDCGRGEHRTAKGDAIKIPDCLKIKPTTLQELLRAPS